MTDRAGITKALEHRRLHEIHECIVPKCEARARFVYHVDEPMRLAGRDWRAGEFIDLCPPHDYELREAISATQALIGYWPSDGQIQTGGGLPSPNPLDRLREWAP